jgi:hypothetical protein
VISPDRPGAVDKPLLQIHIPKTAGTSLRHAVLPEPGDTRHVVAERIPRKRWDASFKFTFVRNPFDRAVSMYTYHTGRKYRGVLTNRYPNLASMSFDEYVETFLVHQESDLFRPQRDYLVHPESPMPVDFVGRFESLADDFARLRPLIGVEGELPHRLKSSRRPFCDYYDDATRHSVATVYAADLELLGYAFDE